ncbi:MAG TPA: aspartyl protease family protein, partial [Candidatus Elarobacter sp.]
VGSTLGTFPESTAIVPQMTIGGLRMRNIVSRVVTIPFHLDDRTRIAGLLGFDFFADAVVHVNFAHNFVEAIATDRFRPPADTAAVALGLDDKTPGVRMRAGSGSGRVVLDTGANRTVFETAFADRADFAPDRVGTAMRVRGMGGFTSAETTRVPQFELGGIWTRNATVDVANADLGTDDLDAVIGTDLLRSYELWFDYRAYSVYVRRAK